MELRRIAINKIVEDPDQPRKVFDETGLAGLADSLRQHGVLNPITVVPLAGVDAYRIVTGERRWRASHDRAGRAGVGAKPAPGRPPKLDARRRARLEAVENQIKVLEGGELKPWDAA